MRVYIDLDLLQLIEAPGVRQPVTTLRVKRGTSPKLEVQFLRDGTPELLPAGSVIRFMLKPTGEYDGDPVVFTDTFTTPDDSSGYYTGRASVNTTAVNALLGSPDGITSNDQESADVMGEFTWYVPGDEPEKSRTFTVTIENAVDNGDEAAPSEAGPSLNTRISALEAVLNNPVKFSVTRTASQTIGGGTLTKVTWQAEEYDFGNCFDSDRFTPVIQGRYTLRGYITFLSVFSGLNVRVEIHKNGLFYKVAARVPVGAGGDLGVPFTVDVVALGEGDYFEVYAFQDDPSSLDISECFWQGATLF